MAVNLLNIGGVKPSTQKQSTATVFPSVAIAGAQSSRAPTSSDVSVGTKTVGGNTYRVYVSPSGQSFIGEQVGSAGGSAGGIRAYAGASRDLTVVLSPPIISMEAERAALVSEQGKATELKQIADAKMAATNELQRELISKKIIVPTGAGGYRVNAFVPITNTPYGQTLLANYNSAIEAAKGPILRYNMKTLEISPRIENFNEQVDKANQLNTPSPMKSSTAPFGLESIQAQAAWQRNRPTTKESQLAALEERARYGAGPLQPTRAELSRLETLRQETPIYTAYGSMERIASIASQGPVGWIFAGAEATGAGYGIMAEQLPAVEGPILPKELTPLISTTRGFLGLPVSKQYILGTGSKEEWKRKGQMFGELLFYQGLFSVGSKLGSSLSTSSKANAFIREDLAMPLKNKIPTSKDLERLARNINPKEGFQITMPKVKPEIEFPEIGKMPTIKELQKEAINLSPKKASFTIIPSERPKLPDIIGKIPTSKDLERLARNINPKEGFQLIMPEIKELPELPIKPPTMADLKKFARELSNAQAETKATKKAMETFTVFIPEEKAIPQMRYGSQVVELIQLEKTYKITPPTKTGYLPFDAYVGKYANQFTNWKEMAKAKGGISQGLLFDITGEQKLNAYISNLQQQNTIGKFAGTRQKTPLEKEIAKSVSGGIKLGTYTGMQLIPKLAYAMGIKTPQAEKRLQKEMMGISTKPTVNISTKITPQQSQKQFQKQLSGMKQMEKEMGRQMARQLQNIGLQPAQMQLEKTLTITQPTIKPKIPFFIPSFSGVSLQKAQKLLPGFFPIIRRAGREVKLTQFPVSKEAARAIAIANVIGSPQASYKLLAGGPAYKIKVPKLPTGIGRMFKPAKTLPGFMVEKPKYRIDMPGEYAGITMKGLATLASPYYRKKKGKKKKKGGWLF